MCLSLCLVVFPLIVYLFVFPIVCFFICLLVFHLFVCFLFVLNAHTYDACVCACLPACLLACVCVCVCVLFSEQVRPGHKGGEQRLAGHEDKITCLVCPCTHTLPRSHSLVLNTRTSVCARMCWYLAAPSHSMTFTQIPYVQVHLLKLRIDPSPNTLH